ncbi:MAG: DUF4352 domain-containing protein [Chloroflexota bacterium]
MTNSSPSHPSLPSVETESIEAGSGAGLGVLLRRQPPLLLALLAILVVVVLVWIGMALRPEPEELDITRESETYSRPLNDVLILVNKSPNAGFPVPVKMERNGNVVPVLPYQVVADEALEDISLAPDSAVWIYGTIVNFVLVVEQNEMMQGWLQDVAVGDEIKVVVSDGTNYVFSSNGPPASVVMNSEIMDQRRPHLTLLIDDGNDYLILEGDLLGTELPAGIDGQASSQIGEPVQIGDLNVTVIEANYIDEDPSLPSGWAYLLIEYQLENLSSTALDPNQLRMDLQDSQGQTHSLSLPASQVGKFGYLMLTVPAHTVAHGTAGYLLPAPMMEQAIWQVYDSLSPDNIATIAVGLSGGTTTPRQVITLGGVELSGTRTQVDLWGTVANQSDSPVNISAQDVDLAGNDGTSAALRLADPAFPWTVAPGEELQFRLGYDRPLTNNATFKVQDDHFEIIGLP